jgi:hypothetical protein
MFVDFDNDGWPDLLLANGHVYPESISNIWAATTRTKILYHNNGNGTFTDISSDAGRGITTPTSARGWSAIYGMTGAFSSHQQYECAMLLVNQVKNGNHWIAFHAIGTKSIAMVLALASHQWRVLGHGSMKSKRIQLLVKQRHAVHFGWDRRTKLTPCITLARAA